MEKVIELIQSAGDGAFAIDRLQRIVFWNDICEDILGYEAADVLGRPCYEVIGGTATNGCKVCSKDCTAVLARTQHKAMPARQFAVRHKDGNEHWISISTILVPSAWSELSVLVHLIRDITVQKNIESLVNDLAGKVTELSLPPHGMDVHKSSGISMTERERQILVAMSTGRSSPEIADDLSISKATVRNHIHHILAKLGVRNRLEAVTVSLRNGLL